MKQPGRFKKTWRALLGGSLLSGFVVLDLVGNGVALGSFDETISSRLGRWQRQGSVTAKVACVGIEGAERALRFVARHPDLNPTNHCEEAAASTGR